MYLKKSNNIVIKFKKFIQEKYALINLIQKSNRQNW